MPLHLFDDWLSSSFAAAPGDSGLEEHGGAVGCAGHDLSAAGLRGSRAAPLRIRSAFAEGLIFTRNTGETVTVSGESQDKCIDDCQVKLKRPPPGPAGGGGFSALGGMQELATGGEHAEIQDCANFCRTEFEVFCFPGDSTVQVRGRGRVALSELREGDAVLALKPSEQKAASGANAWTLSFDKVLAFLHYDPAWEGEFCEIRHELGKVRLTGNHLLFVQRASTNSVEPILARDVCAGDRVLAPWIDGTLATSMVSEPPILVRSRGLYAPLLDSGTVLVDGTAASCYAMPSDVVRSRAFSLVNRVAGTAGIHAVAHALCAPLRAWCSGRHEPALPQRLPPLEAGAMLQDEWCTSDRVVTMAKKRSAGVHPYAWVMYVVVASFVRDFQAKA